MICAGKILYLPLHLVQPGHPERGRNPVALQELAASIGEVGVLQPLTVRKSGREFHVISGNRRFLAARMAGLGEVPCILLDVDAGDGELIFLTENLQREDLGYFQEAEFLRRYLDKSGLTQAQAAKKLGRSQSAIANKLRLLSHPASVREALTEAGLTERHARELLRISGEQARLVAAADIAEKGLSVAQTQRYVDIFLQNGAPDKFLRWERRYMAAREPVRLD